MYTVSYNASRLDNRPISVGKVPAKSFPLRKLKVEDLCELEKVTSRHITYSSLSLRRFPSSVGIVPSRYEFATSLTKAEAMLT